MVPEPREEPPSENVTVPVAAGGETVAVNVTESPYVEDAGDALSVVMVEVLGTELHALIGFIDIETPTSNGFSVQ